MAKINLATTAPQRVLTWRWQDWPGRLRRAILISAGVLAGVGALILFLQDQEQMSAQKLSISTQLAGQSQTKLRASDRERETITKHLPLLRELEAKGIFGEEKRLEWVEQLRMIEKHWPGISITFDIAAQKPFVIDGAPAAMASTSVVLGSKLPSGQPVRPVGVFSSEMQLSMQVLHEGDILAVLAELQAAKLGLFHLKKCSLSRPMGGGVSVTSGGLGAPLTTQCTLQWISLSQAMP